MDLQEPIAQVSGRYNPMPLQVHVLKGLEMYPAARDLLEQHVAGLRMRFTERRRPMDHRRELYEHTDTPMVWGQYVQDFQFQEGAGKWMYNMFRRIRENPTPIKFDVLIIEPNFSFQTAVDAWLLRDATVSRIFNDHEPVRNLKKHEPSDQTHTTTVTLAGRLEHTVEVLDLAIQRVQDIDTRALQAILAKQ